MPIKNLSEFRNIKKLTHDDMAEKLEVSKSFYSKVEYGARNPSFNFIKKFKEVFPEANVDELFFRQAS